MKLKTSFTGIAFVCAILCSCGSSIEGDAKRAADIKCKAEKIMRKAISGDPSAAEESKKLQEEATELYTDMQKKYSSKEDNAKFMKAFIEAASACEP